MLWTRLSNRIIKPDIKKNTQKYKSYILRFEIKANRHFIIKTHVEERNLFTIENGKKISEHRILARVHEVTRDERTDETYLIFRDQRVRAVSWIFLKIALCYFYDALTRVGNVFDATSNRKFSISFFFCLCYAMFWTDFFLKSC